MAHRVETMAYAGETPWHGLGFKVEDTMTPAEMLKAGKIDWTVSKQAVYLPPELGGGKIEGEYALMRDTDRKVLTMVGETWKPVQNADAFDFFTQFTKAGGMKMDTAGSLWGGRYVWGLAKINKGFTLAKGGDEVEGYVLLMSPHILGKSVVIQFTPIRVVCWNTLNMALGSSLRGGEDGAGSSATFRMIHSTKFDDKVKEQAKVALGLAVAQMDEFREVSELLASKRITDERVEEYFCEVLRFDPSKIKAAKAGEKDDDGKLLKLPRNLPNLQQALLTSPGADLKSAKGTWWGALNAVTFFVDHENGRDRDTALKNAWTANMANVKRDALDLAIQYATSKK